MIKNYFNSNNGLNIQKTVALFFVFFVFNQFVNAQCATPIVGCSNTDLSNFGASSNSNAATIEYDNFVSSWHTTVVRTSDGSFQTWGETINNLGANQLSPLTINKANFPALSTGATPLKVALGSSSSNNVQGVLLATDGLYAWSKVGAVLDASLTSSTTFQKVTIGGNANGLPTGVTPADVKMMFGTYKTLAITTCSGDVWVISQTAALRGNGAVGTGNNTTWYRVSTSEPGNPFLTNVVACRGSYDSLIALKADGTVYVWGVNVYLGNNSAAATQNYAAKMTLPSGITPKMIGSTTGASANKSHYVLATDGNLYAIGKNNTRQLGDWTTTDKTAWVQPRYTSAAGQPMNDIKWFSPQEHDATNAAVNVLTNSNNIYAFGSNSGYMLGTTGTADANPVMPNNLTASDNILAVETGGHTSMIVKRCEAKFGYVGHRISGSMGDGTNGSTNEQVYTYATANVQICGAESNPAIQPISTGGGPDSKYCVDDPVQLSPTPAGGTLSILSGPGTLSGNTLNFTGVGTVSVQYSVTTACGGTSVTTRNFDSALCPADLEITKVANNTSPSVGSNVVFTVTAKNNGPYKATGVTVSDALPSGYTFVSATPSVGTWSAPTWTVGSLANGASATLTVTATVNATGSYGNTASITGNNPDNTTTNNSATATPVVQANLSVTKSINNTNPNIGSTVTFTITASNAGPSLATGVKVTDNLPAGYTFVSASPASGTTWSAPDWTIGNLANGASTTLTINATVNASGSYTNTATISGQQTDPTPGNNSGSATPTVNQPPTASNVTNAAIASTASATSISALSATDTDGTIASYTVVALPSHGTLALSGTAVTAGQVLTPAQAASLTYDPAGDFTGNDTFTFRAADNSGASSNTATFTIPVSNNPPTASNVTNAAIASTASATSISALSATDTDGTIASYTVVALPSHGTLALSGTAVTAGQVLTPAQAASLTYDPAGDFTGNDTFTFRAADNSGASSNTATFTIPVSNNPPTASNVTNAAIASTASATSISALSATDTDGTIASFTVVTLPSSGTLALNGTPVTAGQTLTPTQAGQLTYAPSGTFTGNASFTFRAADNSGASSNTATFTIPVSNNPPTSSNVTNAAIASTASATSISSLSATDTDGTIASYTVVALPSHGTLALSGTALTAGQVLTPAQAASLTYDPAGDFTGNDTFTFRASDNSGASSNTATFTIPVSNNPPTASNVTNVAIASTASATSISALSATDTDGTIASYTVVALPSHGTLALSGTPVTAGQVLTPAQAASLTYDPAGDFTGNDTFTFRAADNSGASSNTATFTIPVSNNPPTASNVTNAAIASTASATSISALSATDTDGTIASYTVVALPSHGTLALSGTAVTAGQVLTPAQAASLTYDPAGDFTGNDTFTFRAADNSGASSNTATFTIPVSNNPPTASNVTNAAIASTASATSISALSATDTDGTIASFTVVTLPSSGTLALNGTPVTAGQALTPTQAGQLTYAPSGTFTGNASFTFRAADNSGASSNTATFTIPVSNNPPTASNVTNAAIASTASATSISALSATDTDGTIASFTVVTLPSSGTLALNGTPVTAGQALTPTQAGQLTYAPSGTFTGNASFTFRAADNSGASSNTATFTIPVSNNPPTASNVTNAAIASTASATSISALSATDTDGTIASYTVVALPSHGTLALSGTAVTAGQVLTPAQAASLTYDPAGDFTGNDTFTFRAADNFGASSNTATFTIPVSNNAPTANTAVNTAVIPSTASATAIDALTAADTDGTIASFTVVTLPSHGTLALNGTPVAAGQVLTPAQAASLTYDPAGDFTGDDAFTFTATDNIGAVSASASFTIKVGNNAPSAQDATNAAIASTASATSISALTATDTDGTIASFTVVTLPSNGTLALNGTPVTAGQILTPAQAGQLTYAPSGTFTGSDSFTFTATDNSGATDASPATFTIPVSNNAPTANAAVNTAVIPSTASATAIDALTAADTDGTIASFTVVTLPSHGTLALNGTPVTAGQVLTPAQAASLTYDPAGDFTGDDSFTFIATDNIGAVSASASFTIKVGNNAPSAQDATNAAIASTASATSISALTATDTDGTIASFTVVTLPSNGTLALNGTPVTAGQTLTPAQAGQLTYAPSGTFTGSDSFTFTATDNSGATDATPATFTIPVSNNAPTAIPAVNTAVIPSTASATAIDALTASDTDGTIASYTVVALPSHGTLALNGTPVTAGQVLTPAQAASLTYDPAGDFTGDDSFTFIATDNIGAVSASASFTIKVGNNAPSAQDATNAAIASTASATSISALTATDTDGTIASFTVETLPSNGTLALNGTPVTAGQTLTPAQAGQLTYAPSGTFTGSDSFTFTATDNSGATDATPATFTIPVSNNAPTAIPAVNTAVIPSTASATAIDALTAADTDGTIASYTVVALPSHGTLALNGTPVTAGQVLTPAQAASLTYDPAGDFTGDDSFTFTATDNIGAVSASASFTIKVGNNAPSAQDATNAAIASTASATSISALTATDTDGTIASFTVVTLPSNGTLALNGTPVTAGQILTPAQAGQLTYAPSGTFTGSDSFTFTATDNSGATDASPATFTIPVSNNAPTANTAVNTAVIPSTASATAIDALTASDTDGTIASYTVVALPSHGTLALNGTPVTAGQVLTPAQAASLTYDPAGDFTGDDSFTFTATDNIGAVSASASFTIKVGNNAPSAQDATNAAIASTASATSISALTATDTDGTIASYTVVTLPSNGTLALNGTPVTAGQILTPAQAGQLTYAPSGTFTGSDSFTFTATDNSGATDASPATFTIPVSNNAPTANTAVNTAVIPSTASATAIDALTASDTDGTIASYTVVALPSHGTLALNGTPVTAGQVLTPAQAASLTYDPAGDFTGDDAFTFTATDNIGAVSASASFTIKVGNNAPSAQDATNAAIASTASATSISALTATDTDGTIASFTVVTLPSNGTLALNGTPVTAGQTLTPAQAGQLTYAPSGTFTGSDSFTFTATDNSGATDASPATFTIPVSNNAPTANTAVNTAVIPSTASATAIDALTASDTDGTIASYTVVALPSHGTLALNGTPVTAGQVLTPAQAASLTYDPAGDFTGDDSFTFTATDNIGAVSASASFTIKVGNNAPIANDDTNAAIPSSAGATAIKALSATDSDGTIVSYTIVTLPSHGTLALNGNPITIGQTLTPAEAGQLTYAPNGSFSGNDTFTFTATDNSGAVDATPATITIPVDKRTLVAVKDEIGSVVGINETVKVINVLTNDTLDNNPLTINDVNLNVLTPDPNNVLTLKPDGTAELAPNAPAGTYTLTYEICEKANSGNCTSASVTVKVLVPTMTITAESYCLNNAPYVSYSVKADNFTPTGLLTINWIDSANRIVATQTNMPLSGNVLWPGAAVDGNNLPTDWPGWVLTNGQWIEGNDGFELTRPAVTMQFTLNPTQSVVVNYPAAVSGCNAKPQFGIEAGSDNDITRADGLNGSLEVINVLANDKLNGLPVNPEDVIITANNFPQGITLNQDGTIDVAPGTKGGDYTLTYQICEKANQNNCSSATVRIFVETPSVSLIMKVTLNDENGNGNVEAGETLTYTFTVTNTGNVALSNLMIADLLPGIVITGGPISLGVGQSDSVTFTGTYTLTQADINAGSVTNQASVSGSTQSGIVVADMSDSENLNGDNPTVINLVDGCSIKIYNAVSLNGDKLNERFYIRGIECYPENTVQIYNRWGILVFERDHYNNNDVVFKGYSEGRVTVKESNGLPEGTYYYILRYKDNSSKPKQEAGYLYLTR